MSIEIGNSLPGGHFRRMHEGQPVKITNHDYFTARSIVLFSLPGAFTPTCSNAHLPSYINHFEDFKKLGFDAVACTAVNDAYVMHAWQKSSGADQIDMLADGNGDFVRSLGLETDATTFDMGHRGRRFALIAADNIVTHLFLEPPGEYHVSSAEHVLETLRK